MKQYFHKTISFLMALVVLFSTMSFTVDMHFCGDSLVDTAVFSKATTCGMEMDKVTNSNCTTVKDNCCTEQEIAFKGQKELKTSSEQFTFQQQLFVVSFIQSYINLFEGVQEDTTPFKNYTPPLVVKEIHKLDQVYLI